MSVTVLKPFHDLKKKAGINNHTYNEISLYVTFLVPNFDFLKESVYIFPKRE